MRYRFMNVGATSSNARGSSVVGWSLAGSILAAVVLLAISPVVLTHTAEQPGAAKAQTAVPMPDMAGIWTADQRPAG